MSVVSCRHSLGLLLDYVKLSLLEIKKVSLSWSYKFGRGSTGTGWEKLQRSRVLPSYIQRPSVPLQNRQKNVRGKKMKIVCYCEKQQGRLFNSFNSSSLSLFFLVRVWLLIMRCPGFYSTYFYSVLDFFLSLQGSQGNGIYRLQTVSKNFILQ